MLEEIVLNGRFVPASEAAVSPSDRGFQFAESIYEVIRVYRGRPFEMDRHLRRFRISLDAVGLQYDSLDDLADKAQALVKRGGVSDALIYLQVTSGSVLRAHLKPSGLTPTSVAMLLPVAQVPAQWLSNGTSLITVPDQRWAMCYVKTTMLLYNTLAKSQAVASGSDDAVFVRDGFVTEVTAANIFAVYDGVLCTPAKSNYILHGITREVVLELAAQLGIPTMEGPMPASRLGKADEIFTTTTPAELLPVTRLDGAQVGAGTPGPVWGRLLKAYQERTLGA
jgi:D-alanine transaminase